MQYELNSEFPDNDPGNVLRSALNAVVVSNEARAAANLRELLYTANERGVVDPTEPVAMLRLVGLANSIETPEALEPLRM